MSKINSWLILLFKLLIASIALYAVFTRVPINMVKGHITHADKPLLLLALLLQWASLLFSSLRSQHYLAYYGLRLKYVQTAAIYYIGAMFNIILPGGIGGDGYRMILLAKDHQFPKLTSLRVMLYERASGLYGLSLLCLILLPWTSFYQLGSLAQAIIILCLIMVTPCYFLGAKYILRDNIKIALKTAPLSLVIQLLQVISAICVIYALNKNAPMLEVKDYTALFLLASIAATIPISIGGAGLRELTFLYGIEMLGYSDLSFGVSIALTTFLLTTAAGMAGLPVWLWRRK